MPKFDLRAPFKPTGDQPQAIKNLVWGIKNGRNHQVLLGVTGSGKTFTMANVVSQVDCPALIISHNKTLAAQTYQEFKTFFPKNNVSFFVSYYDYYQPEAYLPSTDTYIEKEVDINEEIDRLRLEATTNILNKKDVIVVASVSCIYNLGAPRRYSRHVLKLKKGKPIERRKIMEKLVNLQYQRADYQLQRGTFRVRGKIIDIFPAYKKRAVRIEIKNKNVEKVYWINPLTGKKVNDQPKKIKNCFIYPAKHYMTDSKSQEKALSEIKKDLNKQIFKLKREEKLLEAQRLKSRVNYDLEMIRETGYVNGIENYSRYFDGRQPGDPPFCLLYYFEYAFEKWLLFVDESHQTIPQLRGMYRGDRSRKKTLINHGFRLPAALDNRPLKFKEFLKKIPQTLYVSATPSDWEIKKAQKGVVEQLIRPTGVCDPKIIIRPTDGQIDDLIEEIEKRIEKKERVLVTTLTKKTAEALAEYLKKKKIKVHYLHSEIETLKRSEILDNLREGEYDVVVGINLLREGLDLPEVSLVAILDADKEGFLRSETSLIQTMGRAARHINGRVIMYADKTTRSMEKAIDEVHRRRAVQIVYNQKNKITPKTVRKPIRKRLVRPKKETPLFWQSAGKSFQMINQLKKIEIDGLTPHDKKILTKKMKKEMKKASRGLNFELAAYLRDKIQQINKDSL